MPHSHGTPRAAVAGKMTGRKAARRLFMALAAEGGGAAIRRLPEKHGVPPVSLPEPPRLPGSSPDPTPSGQPSCGFPSLPFFARLLPQAEPTSQGPANVRSAATRKRVKCTCFYKVFAADPRLSRGNAQANIYKPTGPMPKGIGPVLTVVSFCSVLIPARADSP